MVTGEKLEKRPREPEKHTKIKSRWHTERFPQVLFKKIVVIWEED